MKKFICFLFCVAIIAGCATSSIVSEQTTPGDAGSASTLNSTPETLMQGQELYAQKCGKCHELHAPSDFSKQAWEKILPSMIRKAKLGEGEGVAVHQYVFSEIDTGK